VTGDSQLYAESAGTKKISTFGYKTYMLGCKIPGQYTRSTSCTKKGNKQDCNAAKGCVWCGDIFPSCRPLDQQAILNCTFDDHVDCTTGFYVDDDGVKHCRTGCRYCDKVGPGCVASSAFDHVCQKWP
jgi:hypothetical protein